MKQPTLVILAAGKGNRMGPKAEYLHKALFPLAEAAVISRILQPFSESLPVVVACGHLTVQLQTYLHLAHPDRSFQFIEVPGYDQPGSGPGTSLLYCRPYIPDRFYLTTVDTIIENPIPEVEQNWLGVGPIENPESFCTVALDVEGKIISFADKQKGTPNRLAFIGLAGIATSEVFWKALASNTTLIRGERQLSNGLQALMSHDLHAKFFDWIDTGSEEKFALAKKRFEKERFDFSKDSEYTYRVNGRVIKWFRDETIARKRADRAGLLAPCTPEIICQKNQFFSYREVHANTLYRSLSNFKLQDLFNWLEQKFWSKKLPEGWNRAAFQQASRKFYIDKTEARFASALKKTGLQDQRRMINGMDVLSVSDLLSMIDYQSFLEKGIPGQFHGDLHFENTLLTSSWPEPFVLIDWRQDFGGLDYGDRYYDLAKLNGCFSLNYAQIQEGHPLDFIEPSGEKNIVVWGVRDEKLLRYKKEFDTIVTQAGYDLDHIELLTSLIYLNMAPLHNPPFDRFLIYYGQWRLANALKNSTKEKPTLQKQKLAG